MAKAAALMRVVVIQLVTVFGHLNYAPCYQQGVHRLYALQYASREAASAYMSGLKCAVTSALQAQSAAYG